MATQVKICGVRTSDALEACARGGADYVGFVFYPPSPRFLTPQMARDLCANLSRLPAKVALTVNADDALLEDIVTHVSPDYLQFHGSETPTRVREVKTRFNVPVIKAIALADASDVVGARLYEGVADILLFDAKPRTSEPSLPGGNARRFDWRLAAGQNWAGPWMLSGGLNAQNVAEAIAVTGAPGVDISSGVERIRGQKDPALITEFLKTLG